MLSWIIFAAKCQKLPKLLKKAFSFGFRKSRGQVLSALNFFPKQDLYYANNYMNNFAAFGLNCFYFLNIFICIAWTSVNVDMPLSGAYNQKMATIRLILTAEYERLGPN